MSLRVALRRALPLIDLLALPALYPAALFLKLLRRTGFARLPRCRAALVRVGLFPIRNHYYEPQFDFRAELPDTRPARALPGVDWNVPAQLALLEELRRGHELANTPTGPQGALSFHFGNGAFESGDAELLYQLIRHLRPRRVFEVGSGSSTLMAARAIAANGADDPAYGCRHVCIEPYEQPWLEQLGVEVIRRKVEVLGTAFFAELDHDDLLFIDSSHVIRPYGDVLFELLELLPTLRKGVVVHIHDIFSPRNYPSSWIEDEVRLWNEQYILEAFLTHNKDWSVMAAVNHLHHHHFDRLKQVAPFLTPEREPGSFYLRKVG